MKVEWFVILMIDELLKKNRKDNGEEGDMDIENNNKLDKLLKKCGFFEMNGDY